MYLNFLLFNLSRTKDGIISVLNRLSWWHVWYWTLAWSFFPVISIISPRKYSPLYLAITQLPDEALLKSIGWNFHSLSTLSLTTSSITVLSHCPLHCILYFHFLHCFLLHCTLHCLLHHLPDLTLSQP